jgi:hypothetical protein
MWWRSGARAQFIGRRPESEEERGFQIALASLSCGRNPVMARWPPINRGCHLSDSPPRHRGSFTAVANPSRPSWRSYRQRGSDLYPPLPPPWCTVPLQARFSAPDSPSLGLNLSYFSVVTHLKFCSKVVDQGFGYNFATATKTKLLLDHAYNRALTSCHLTVRPKFSFQTAWHPIFGCNYLQILHNNHAYTLKQSYYPLIGLQYWCGDLG